MTHFFLFLRIVCLHFDRRAWHKGAAVKRHTKKNILMDIFHISSVGQELKASSQGKQL